MPVTKTDLVEFASNNPFLNTAEKKLVQEKKEERLNFLSNEGVAKFKLELFFGNDFALSRPSKGIISFWESGAKLRGDGDVAVYQCPGKSLGKSNCEAFIPDEANSNGELFCVKCKTQWKGAQVAGQVIAKLTPQNWAGLLTKLFRLMEHKADIVIKHPVLALREAAFLEQEKQHMGELLDTTRSGRVTRVYTLKRLLADTAAGADIQARILAFIRA